MKKFCLFATVALLALTVSCEKPQSEAERNAQVEREVQQRLANERTAAEQQRLAQQQADLAAREQALADREAAAQATATPAEETATTTERTTAAVRTSTDDAAATSYDTFYRKLEPYGAWRETADYGYVWQPQQAQRSADWRPYTDGRWAYTDAGWTWVSEEPFGWATYHYGRWTHLRAVGWVWVPGEEWAPAWVSWRKSDEFVGWGPLPPEAHFDRRHDIQKWADSYYDIDAGEYVFIPNEAIGSPQLRQEVVPVQRNVTIINQTTNITNITYSNTTVVNVGPNFDELRAHSRQPIERLRLERTTNAEGGSPNAVVRGDVLAVSAPVFVAQAAERPRNVGQPIAEVAVDRNYGGNVDQAEAERVRQKMKSEATPPPDAPPKRYNKPVVSKSAGAPAMSASPGVSISPAAAVSATPAPSVTMTPRALVSATPTMTPRPTMAPTASMTPRATATPKQTTSPAPTATATPSPSSTPIATPHVRPSVTPPPSAAATSSAKPSVTPLVTATPRAVSPMPTRAPSIAASPRPTSSISSSPTVSPIATPVMGGSPAVGSAEGEGSPHGAMLRHPGAGGAPRRPDQLRNPDGQPPRDVSPVPPASDSVAPQTMTPRRPHALPPGAVTPPPAPIATPTPFVRPSPPAPATLLPSTTPISAVPPPARQPMRHQAPPVGAEPERGGSVAPGASAAPGRPGPHGPRGEKRVPPEPGASASPTVSPNEAPQD